MTFISQFVTSLMSPESTHKSCNKPPPYHRKTKPVVEKGTPKTSAQPVTKQGRENLTIYDWLTVFAFWDEHPSMNRTGIINHFKARAEGALLFDQSILSWKWKNRMTIQKQAQATPSALSSKRMCIVMQPDVECTLVLWIKHMEEKGETVNGPMLKEKRWQFKNKFDVPEKEQLGDGWIALFCKTYNTS